MAEFALVAPIFLLVMMGLLELGRAVYYTQILDSAARDGARYAIVHGFQSIAGSSGPMPGDVSPVNTNTFDPNGLNVIQTVVDRSIGVTDKASDLTAHVKWCNAAAYQADPPASQCYDWLPCVQWTNPTYDPSGFGGLGDGNNNRGQLVSVCVSYSYQSLFSSFLPVPDFTVTGRASLVVNN